MNKTEFKSVEEIQKYFGINKSALEELRKELVIMLANYHPDKTGGTFANKMQERNYDEVNCAIEFLDESSKEVAITKHELADIFKKIEELTIIASTKVEEVPSQEKAIERLENSINTSIIQFQKRHLAPKISSLAVSGALTILWTFPNIAFSHPILKQFISPNNLLFSALWIFSLVMTGTFWLFVKRKERIDELIKKSYSFDSTQNNIFKLFICFIQATNSRSVDWNTHRKIIRFTKDEIINFILNHYDNLEGEFRNDLNIDLSSLYLKINDYYKENKIIKHRPPKTMLFSFLESSKAGEIEIEFAQQVSETIINKLLRKGIINISEKQSFGDTYEYMDNKYS